jgi:hypothetical protein
VSAPAAAPLILMSIAAPLGAFDVLYFHIYKYRLYRHRHSLLENITHFVRGLLFATVAFLLTRYEPLGTWYWVVAGLIALDFSNNVADVILEPRSRAPLGGLPPLEYVIHIIGSMFSGLIGATWVLVGAPLADAPTALAPAHDLPAWLVLNGHMLYIGAILMFLFELTLLIRARRPSPA